MPPVTPHVGVWIETRLYCTCRIGYTVTPHVGVWIETGGSACNTPHIPVTPHVGVWIETDSIQATDSMDKSLPMWECGLKRPLRLFRG